MVLPLCDVNMFFYFRFKRIVFLATVRAVRTVLDPWVSSCITDISPKMNVKRCGSLVSEISNL